MPEWLTIKQAAALIGISPKALRRTATIFARIAGRTGP